MQVTGSGNLTLTATHGSAGSSVSPVLITGLQADITTDLATNGITYHPGNPQPATDKVTLAVNDSFGATDIVNFVFNQAGTGPNIALQGTSGKDVIFAGGTNSILA